MALKGARLTIVCALLAAGVAAAETAPALQEAVIVVGDLERAAAAFQGPLQWRVVSRGPADPSAVRALDLPVDTAMQEAVLAPPGADRGWVRLLHMAGADAATPIRAGAAPWDIGGIASLSLAVADVQSVSTGLRRMGWSVSVDDGTATARGPDDVILHLAAGSGGLRGAVATVPDLGPWTAAIRASLAWPVSRPERVSSGARDVDLPDSAGDLAARDRVIMALGPSALEAQHFLKARGRDLTARVRAPAPGVVALRLPVADAATVAARAKAAGVSLAAPLQIVRLAPYGTVRLVGVRLPGGLAIEAYTPGARPMTEGELHAMFPRGGYATWVRFNNQLTGNVRWNPDGTAHVVWDTGTLDELGTWTIKGDAVCTAWTRLRSNRELCVHHYRLDDRTTQSFRVEGGAPDGIYSWE